MDRTQVVFTGGMLALLLVVGAWMAVGAWPTGGLWYRAELGDQMAIAEMRDRALAAHDIDAYAGWAVKIRKLTPTEMAFMVPESRRIMQKLSNAQGIETPLIDVIEKQ